MIARGLAAGLLVAFAVAPVAVAQSSGTIEINGFARNSWFDDELQLDDAVGGGGSLGVFLTRNLALEAEGTYLTTPGPLGADVSNTRALGRLVYNLPLGGYASAILIGAGYARNMYGEGADADEDAVTGLVGLRIGFTENFALRLAATVDAVPSPTLLPNAEDNYNHGAQAGLTLLFGNSYDRDKDGVKDKVDACAGTPPGESVDPSGCSASQRDTDGDRVKDNADKCPGTAAGQAVDAEGCSPSQKDADADGVQDAGDRCAATPGGEQVDADGCGASQRDSDGDGATDDLDKCPDTPTGESVDGDGCSGPQRDADRDGVPDAADACPATPAGAPVDERGCRPLFRGTERQVVLHGVTFELNSAELTSGSRDVLLEVGRSLVANPEVRVEVAGYTDSRGSDAYNRRLSERRAQAVERFLEGNGVSPAQLTARGYGEAGPVASNNTEEGRAQNRRVELKRLN
jgi:OOP family OmpA-OmpF porin